MTGLIDLYRSMKRFTLAAGLGAAVGLAAPMMASAQDDGGTPSMRSRGHHHGGFRRQGNMRGNIAGRIDRMIEELGLTPAQQARIQSVLAQAREERRGLREQGGRRGSPEAQAHRQRVHAQIEQILTPAQRARAEQLRQQHRQQHGERRLAHMRERLELTPAQEAQVRSIMTRTRAERERITQTTEAGSDARREAMRGLHQRTGEAIRGVLTPEQQARMGRRGGFGRGPRR